MKNILEYLEATASEHPDKTAFSDGESAISFGELLSLSRAGGSKLLSRGARTGGKPVAVFMKKCPQTIAAFFAVTYAGCCYVPLEMGLPMHRVRKILEKISPEIIICDDSSAEKCAEFGYGKEILPVEELFSGTSGDELGAVRAQSIDIDPVYIVFTSGSTGEPKGVTACHRSLIDYASSLCPVLGAGPESVFAMQVPLYVDACMKEILSAIKCGSTVYLMQQSLFMSPLKVLDFLNRYKINTISWVASALTLVSGLGAFEEGSPESLRTICFGSEVFPVKQLKAWQKACPEARFVNLYGPTECTGMSFYYEVDRSFEESEIIPVGRPFDNTAFMLLKEDDSLAEAGEVGEICIRGTAVTLGYYDDPERTAAVFTQNPLNPHYPEIIYRTGDLGRLNEKGELLFVSRKDSQIKNMGHRIELGEIEVNCNMLPGIKLCGCIYDQVKGKIALYYTGDLEPKEVTVALKEKLPRYMIPNYVRSLEEMPLTANGKINRVALKQKYEDEGKKETK